MNDTVTAPVDDRRGWLALALLCVAQFVVTLDVQIVAIALPSIGRDLSMAQADLQWVVSAYVLTFGGFLLLSGRMADLFGRRRLFMLGFALFTAASLGCGLANSGALLVAARAAQGLGAALIAPAALSLLTTAFEEGPRRTYALGVWGAAAPLGGASGFLLGGLLTGGPGWPWVFLVNVPVGLLTLALAPLLLGESRDRAGAGRLDVAGALTGPSGLVVLVYALTQAEQAGFGAPATLSLLVLASALIAIFCLIEGHVKDPLVPFAIFRQRNVVEANLIYLVLTAVNAPVLFLLTLYLQGTLGYTPLEAVLSDTKRRGAEAMYCLGDLIGKGPEGALAVDTCREACEVVVRGNWDDGVATIQTPDTEVGRWHQAQLGRARLHYLGALPNSFDFTMSGRRIRLFHASPESVYKRVYENASSEEQQAMFVNTPFTGYGVEEPDVVGYGDVHVIRDETGSQDAL